MSAAVIPRLTESGLDQQLIAVILLKKQGMNFIQQSAYLSFPASVFRPNQRKESVLTKNRIQILLLKGVTDRTVQQVGMKDQGKKEKGLPASQVTRWIWFEGIKAIFPAVMRISSSFR